jgi:hypothetical protein
MCVSSMLSLPLGLFFSEFNSCTYVFPLPWISHAPSHLTSFYHPIVGLFCDKYYEVSLIQFSSSVLSLPPFYVQTFFSAPYSQTSRPRSSTIHSVFTIWWVYIQSIIFRLLIHIQIKLCLHLLIPVLHYSLTHSFNHYQFLSPSSYY